MTEVVSIVLPEQVSEDDAQEIQNFLKNVDGIEDAGSISSRSMADPASITLWIEVASGILGLVSTAVPVIQNLMEIFRKKNLPAAKIKLPDGTEIEFDKDSSPDEIANMIRAIKGST
jgi:hypothetical protein